MAKNPEPEYVSSSPELETLARLLYSENRQNLTLDEAAAIVRTAVERQKLAGYPEDLLGVLAQPGQYQGLNPPAGSLGALKRNAEETASFGPGHPRWLDFISMAQYGLQEARKPNPNAPTHYFRGEAPTWAQGMELTQIGAHKFGRERRRAKQELGSPKPKKSKP